MGTSKSLTYGELHSVALQLDPNLAPLFGIALLGRLPASARNSPTVPPGHGTRQSTARDRIPANVFLHGKEPTIWHVKEPLRTIPSIRTFTTFAGTARWGTTSNRTNVNPAIREGGNSANVAKT